MRHRLTILCLSLAVLLCGAADAFAGASPTLSRIVERGELRVGMSGNQPPFVMKDREGNLMGFEVELAGAVADAMGVKLKLITRPFGQLLSGLREGDVDMVMSGVTMTPQRNMEFAFVGPYFVSGKAVLTKSQTLAQVQDAGEFDQENLTLVALQGSTSEQFIREVLPKAKLTTVEDYDMAVQMVREDKVKAMVADRPICVISVLRYPSSGLTTTARPLTLEPIGVAVPPDDPLFVNFMDNLFSAIEVTGGFELLTKKWFESSGWLAALP